MTGTSALAVIDGLLDGLTSAFAGQDVLVVDGFGLGDRGYRTTLHVGVEDPLSQDRAASADADQQWSQIGGQQREEQGRIRSVLTAWGGDNELRALRATAAACMDTVKRYLDSSHDLGVVQLVRCAAITDISIYQDQDADGSAVVVAFTISYTARINRSA